MALRRQELEKQISALKRENQALKSWMRNGRNCDHDPTGREPMDSNKEQVLEACVRAADAYLRASEELLVARVGLAPDSRGTVERASAAMARLGRATKAAMEVLTE